MKKVDFTIVTIPKWFSAECPYCELEFDIDYDEFCDTDNPFEVEGKVAECPWCKKEMIVDDVEFD